MGGEIDVGPIEFGVGRNNVVRAHVNIDGEWQWLTPDEIAERFGTDRDQVVERLCEVVAKIDRDLEGLHNYFDAGHVVE